MGRRRAGRHGWFIQQGKVLLGASLLLLLLNQEAHAVEVTLFFNGGSGGFGYVVRRPWYVDGAQFVEIKGGERVTIDLTVGKHTFRNQRNTSASSVVNVQGTMTIKYGDIGFVESLPDQDPELKAELDSTTPVQPTAFAPRR